jgi:cyclopropane fatty-acyl-phospholipid synthase-like methyltransferase
MYQDFAAVYDRLMSRVDYPAWAARYVKLLDLAGVKQGGNVLEAACGTGNLSIHLAKQYRLTAGDISQEMLSRAVVKARAQGLQIPFLRQDMRSLQAHRLQDAVIAGCDGVNYLLTPEDLRRFLSSAFHVLKPGGALAFDVSTSYKLRRVLGNKPQVLQEDDICYLWENAWQPQGRKLHMSLAVFVLQPEGTWQRVDETQVQRAWTVAQLRRALASHGFGEIQVFGEHGLLPPAAKDQRIYVLAVKTEAR